MACVYTITNLKNLKRYVGKTVHENPLRRWKQHVNCAKNGKGYALHAAMRKHHIENFEFVVAKTLDTDEEALAHEKQLIAELGTFGKEGYNLTTGGDGPKMSEETKAKLSAAKKGKPNLKHRGFKHSAESRRLMSESQKRHAELVPWTEEHRIAQSNRVKGVGNPMYGRTHTDEAKARISAAHVGIPLSEDHRASLRAAIVRRDPEVERMRRKRLSVATAWANNPAYGKPLPEDRKAKISAALTGKKLDDAHRKAISEGGKRRWAAIRFRKSSHAWFMRDLSAT